MSRFTREALTTFRLLVIGQRNREKEVQQPQAAVTVCGDTLADGSGPPRDGCRVASQPHRVRRLRPDGAGSHSADAPIVSAAAESELAAGRWRAGPPDGSAETVQESRKGRPPCGLSGGGQAAGWVQELSHMGRPLSGLSGSVRLLQAVLLPPGDGNRVWSDSASYYCVQCDPGDRAGKHHHASRHRTVSSKPAQLNAYPTTQMYRLTSK